MAQLAHRCFTLLTGEWTGVEVVFPEELPGEERRAWARSLFEQAAQGAALLGASGDDEEVTCFTAGEFTDVEYLLEAFKEEAEGPVELVTVWGGRAPKGLTQLAATARIIDRLFELSLTYEPPMAVSLPEAPLED